MPLFVYVYDKHTHTHTHIYIYIYTCVCVCVSNKDGVSLNRLTANYMRRTAKTIRMKSIRVSFVQNVVWRISMFLHP
jgi:hypothetical protein